MGAPRGEGGLNLSFPISSSCIYVFPYPSPFKRTNSLSRSFQECFNLLSCIFSPEFLNSEQSNKSRDTNNWHFLGVLSTTAPDILLKYLINIPHWIITTLGGKLPSWVSEGSEQVNSLPKVTQPVSSKAEIRT